MVSVGMVMISVGVVMGVGVTCLSFMTKFLCDGQVVVSGDILYEERSCIIYYNF